MKPFNVFWIVIGMVSIVVALVVGYLAYILNNGKILWGLLLMPVLWADTKNLKNKK